MMIIGCDLHTRYQQIAMLDTPRNMICYIDEEKLRQARRLYRIRRIGL
jgi:hypothetical protein